MMVYVNFITKNINKPWKKKKQELEKINTNIKIKSVNFNQNKKYDHNYLEQFILFNIIYIINLNNL